MTPLFQNVVASGTDNSGNVFLKVQLADGSTQDLAFCPTAAVAAFATLNREFFKPDQIRMDAMRVMVEALLPSEVGLAPLPNADLALVIKTEAGMTLPVRVSSSFYSALAQLLPDMRANLEAESSGSLQ
jgi:hypothetical protein